MAYSLLGRRLALGRLYAVRLNNDNNIVLSTLSALLGHLRPLAVGLRLGQPL